MHIPISAALAAAAAAAAIAQSPQRAEAPKPEAIQIPLEGDMVQATWRAKPTGEQMSDAYPRLAHMMDIEGSAVVQCETDIDGAVSNCKVLSDAPRGFGFGDAGLRMSTFFKMNPATLDGTPVRSSVTVPLIFKQQAPPVEPQVAAPVAVPEASLKLALQITTLMNYSGRFRAAWQAWLDQESARSLVEGHPQDNQRALAAFRQGFDDVLGDEIDRRARRIASQMTEDDLRATVTFLSASAGRGFITAFSDTDVASSATFMQRLSKAARSHLCLEPTCHVPPSSAAHPPG